jgi:uncharacterized protein YndB with AHSA1/START domain
LNLENSAFSRAIAVSAPASAIWSVLTDPVLIEQWLADTYVKVDIDWRPGGAIRMYGDHGGLPFENRGTVKRFEPERLLEYTFWSSVSEQPDEPRCHSVIRFTPEETGNQTRLVFDRSNLTTYTILKHSEMYWNVTLQLIKHPGGNVKLKMRMEKRIKRYWLLSSR